MDDPIPCGAERRTGHWPHHEHNKQNAKRLRKKHKLTLEIPRPALTPNPRNNHHSPAPAIPAAPVPLDQAPRAVLDVERVGNVVVSCKNVNSPSPDERDAREIPNSRAGRPDERAIVCGSARSRGVRVKCESSTSKPLWYSERAKGKAEERQDSNLLAGKEVSSG